MKLIRIGSLSILMASMVLAFQNCGHAGDPMTGAAATQPSANAEQITTLKSSIQSMSQQDVACTQDSDCTVISLPPVTGCGPQEYWVTSAHNAEIGNLQSLVGQLAQVEADMADQDGTVSACVYMVLPTPACQQNVCAPSFPNLTTN